MLLPGDRLNFDTLRRACHADDLALLECVDSSGEYVAVVVAVAYDPTTKEYGMTPLAQLFKGDPYAVVTPASDVAAKELCTNARGD